MNSEEIENIVAGYKKEFEDGAYTPEDIFAGHQMLTESVSDRISTGYDNISTAISLLDSRDPKMGEKKHLLQEMKRTVPTKYAITIDEMVKLNQMICDVVGSNIYIAKKIVEEEE